MIHKSCFIYADEFNPQIIFADMMNFRKIELDINSDLLKKFLLCCRGEGSFDWCQELSVPKWDAKPFQRVYFGARKEDQYNNILSTLKSVFSQEDLVILPPISSVKIETLLKSAESYEYSIEEDGNYLNLHSLTNAAIDLGSGLAMTLKSGYLSTGVGCEINHKLSSKLKELAVDYNCVMAKFMLGRSLIEETWLGREEEGEELCQQAVKESRLDFGKDIVSSVVLFSAYSNGYGSQSNIREAYKAIEEATEANYLIYDTLWSLPDYRDEQLFNSFQNSLELAIQEKKDYEAAWRLYELLKEKQSGDEAGVYALKALEFSERAAVAGNLNACFYLGQYTYEFKGQSSSKAAFSNWIKAAEGGHSEAQYTCARAYLCGLGVKANLKLAYYWLLQAAENQHFIAMYLQSIFLETGLCCEKDLSYAKYLRDICSVVISSQEQIEIRLTLLKSHAFALYIEQVDAVFQKNKNFDEKLHYLRVFNTLYSDDLEISHFVQSECEKLLQFQHAGAMFFHWELQKDKGVEIDRYYLEKACEGGDPEAQFVLSGLLDQGDESFTLLETSAKAGYSSAALSYGKKLIQNMNSEGIEFLERVIHSEVESAYLLGELYRQGELVPENEQKAIAHYLNASRRGCAESMFRLAQMGLDLNGEKSEIRQRLQVLKKSAMLGNPFAQFELGKLYSSGVDVSRNYEKAFKWFTLAANQGNEQASYQLYYFYQHGMGIPKDPVMAEKSLDLCISFGNLDAHYMKAENFWSSQATCKAEKLWQTASANGHTPSMVRLGMIFENRGEFLKAFAYYEEAFNCADALGAFCLGCLYENGQACEQDYDKAIELFQYAYDAGINDASERLQVLLNK